MQFRKPSFRAFRPYKPNFHFSQTTKSLKTYVYPDNWDSIREEVLRRDNYTCQICGTFFGKKNKHKLRAHHKIALSRGGNSLKSNLETVCKECHAKIHHKEC